MSFLSQNHRFVTISFFIAKFNIFLVKLILRKRFNCRLTFIDDIHTIFFIFLYKLKSTFFDLLNDILLEIVT